MSWQLDPGHTYIGFTGRHLMVATVRGEFEQFSGTVEFDEEDITRSQADIQIEAASVNTRNAQRDEHFRSADFFDVEHYPYITFKSKRVIMQDAHHPWNTYSAGFSLHGKVNRKDWGMKWNMVLAGGGLAASDEITLTIDLELTKPVEAVATTQAGEASA